MKSYLTTICLTLVLSLGAVSAAWSADYETGLAAKLRGDYATALREWTPLAKQGNTAAQYFLSVMYGRGQGVPQDYKTAVKWYRLAAEQGDASAQIGLGWMYALGTGVTQDYVLAHMWFNIATSNGLEDAATIPDIVASKMTSADISTAQKLARECVRKKYKDC